MSLRLLFLNPKDPGADHGGDLALSNLLMDLAREAGHEVHCVCLSTHAGRLGSTRDVTRIHKPPVSPASLAARSVARRRSIVHSRYDEDAVVAALDARAPVPDVVVAEHSYMAEPFLRSTLAGRSRLLVDTHNPESVVWRETRGPLARLDARRIRADETRVARRAHSVATFDRDELVHLRRIGAARPTWLDLTLRPGRPVHVADTPPRLLFVGAGAWAPNREAAAVLRTWWPEIRRGIPDAELWLAGDPGPSSRARREAVRDASVHECGFVPDLDAVMDSCRALVAPIRLGGGVRVKVLHALSRGLPIVTTSTGLGSLDELSGTRPFDGRSAFVERCRELLLSPAVAAREGRRGWQAVTDHWAAGRPQAAAEAWWST